jgi:ATP-dependent DNA helicase RecG
MSEILSVSQRTIERDISALQKIGVLKREGKDNDGLWIIVNY